MNKLLLAVIAVVISLLWGCCPCRHITTDTRQMDSTEVKVRTKTIYIPDTVLIPIPAQQAERTTFDRSSHLENDFAESDARINDDGSLFHNLLTKPQDYPALANKQIEYRDSIVYKTKYKDRVITEEVERELSWWQRTQIYGFWAAIALFAIIYRKKILSIIRVFI